MANNKPDSKWSLSDLLLFAPAIRIGAWRLTIYLSKGLKIIYILLLQHFKHEKVSFNVLKSTLFCISLSPLLVKEVTMSNPMG